VDPYCPTRSANAVQRTCVITCSLTFSNPKYLSLPSWRTGSSASGANSFSNAVGTGAFGSFFTSGCAAEALGVCEYATTGQFAESDAEVLVVDMRYCS
jgi:hypothetical protein